MSKRNGPKLTIVASCMGCAYEHSESYSVQGDSCQNVTCTYPGIDEYIGDTTWNTPEWCQLFSMRLYEFIQQHKDKDD